MARGARPSVARRLARRPQASASLPPRRRRRYRAAGLRGGEVLGRGSTPPGIKGGVPLPPIRPAKLRAATKARLRQDGALRFLARAGVETGAANHSGETKSKKWRRNQKWCKNVNTGLKGCEGLHSVLPSSFNPRRFDTS